MQPTPIVRPSWLALHRRTVLGVVWVGAIGALGAWYIDKKTEPAQAVVQAVPSIVTVQVPVPGPAIPPPAVNVTVQPPPPPEPPMLITPVARALTPFLDASCIATTQLHEEGPGRCSWHDGFPAISEDGETIVVKYSSDDGGRGYYNLSVRFIDAATSKVISDHVIVSPEELDEEGQATDKTRALVKKRVAPIQKRLDAQKFRTMEAIANEIPEPTVTTLPTGMRLEYTMGETMARIVDGDSNTVVWRGEFDVTTKYPPKKYVSDEDLESCYPTNTNGVMAWFDPATRVVAFEVTYGSGPCYCSSTIDHYARRLAPQ